MNKQEYLRQLAAKLKSLSKDEVEKSVSFYAEMIDDRIEDGVDETVAVQAVGSVDEAVRNIRLEHASLPSLVKARVSDSKQNATNKGLWIVLAIIGCPLWLPIVLAIALMVLSLYLVIWCLVVAVYALEFALLVGGIKGIALGIFYLFTLSLPVGLCYIGVGLVCIAATVLLFKPVNAGARAIIGLSKQLVLKVKSVFVKKEIA